ncbi:CRISPR-associated protein Csm5 [Candidatus Termititenax persephonae]|uniref:CRISPR system Cms protein Csm5 n=1 Tax=Candidatus Termititenax persephonae TaxID=2218525 RepID=A0A388TGW1_9BACT|nr:CRISPR-associated protein Csm5 [Candidatus Termititenax persephonae]
MSETKPQNICSYEMKLYVLSPLFIGDGESIKGIKSEVDFRKKILKKDKQRIEQWINYFTNFAELKRNEADKEKQNRNRAQRYERRIPKEANQPSLSGYLRFIKDSEFKPNKKPGDFIQTAGRGYVPGSSIKGAIRTALIAELIREKKLSVTEAEAELKEAMKYIQVTDTNICPETKFVRYRIKPQKIIDNKQVGYSSRNFTVDKKFLKDGTILTFGITIDEKRSGYTLKRILEGLDKHYGQVLQENKEALGNKDNIRTHDYTEEQKQNLTKKDGITKLPNINIGGQSGFNTKIVLCAVHPDNHEYMAAKKKILAEKFGQHVHDRAALAPRYLKFAEIHEPEHGLTPGWCRIVAVKKLC